MSRHRALFWIKFYILKHFQNNIQSYKYFMVSFKQCLGYSHGYQQGTLEYEKQFFLSNEFCCG